MTVRKLKRTSWPLSAAGLCLAVLATPARAQKVIPQPVTDSATQASPLTPLPKQPVVDGAVQASPITVGHPAGRSIAAHTAIAINLKEAVDSGHMKNGQTLHAKLTAAVHASGGPELPAGTPVSVTVVETVPAGRMMAVGEISLQVVRVGTVDVYTDTLTFRGKPGRKDLPDSAPALGTDAGLPDGAPLTFHVLPPPAAASDGPKPNGAGPGSVNGVAAGGPPPAGSTQQPGSGAGNGPGTGKSTTTANQVQPADTTPRAAQNKGQAAPAPNQPQQPSTPNSASPTQPR